MIINYIHNFCYLDLVSTFFEYQSFWMDQIHCILSFSISCKWVASSDMGLHQHLNSVSGMNFIYTLMHFISHFSTKIFSAVLASVHIFLIFVVLYVMSKSLPLYQIYLRGKFE